MMDITKSITNIDMFAKHVISRFDYDADVLKQSSAKTSFNKLYKKHVSKEK